MSGASLLLTSFKDINDNKLKVHGFATTYATVFLLKTKNGYSFNGVSFS